MRKLLLLAFITIGSCSFATITTATSSGDWGEAGTWDNGVPGCFDTIMIPATIQVDITSTVDIESCPDSILVIVYGRIEFQNGKKLKLPCFSDVLVYPGGSVGVGSGGGSSTYIEMCSTQYWNASSGDLTGPTSLCDGTCPANPGALPIELLFFEAVYDPTMRQTELKWVTLSEVDNEYFTVQRSSNGVDWVNLFEVDGAGTTSARQEYNEVDPQPLYGHSYYRLMQTDVDGDFSYSPIVSIQRNESGEIFMYPNPVDQNGQVVITFPETGEQYSEILIYTAEGKTVYTNTIDLFESRQLIVQIDDKYQSGLYLLKCADQNVKFIVR